MAFDEFDLDMDDEPKGRKLPLQPSQRMLFARHPVPRGHVGRLLVPPFVAVGLIVFTVTVFLMDAPEAEADATTHEEENSGADDELARKAEQHEAAHEKTREEIEAEAAARERARQIVGGFGAPADAQAVSSAAGAEVVAFDVGDVDPIQSTAPHPEAASEKRSWANLENLVRVVMWSDTRFTFFMQQPDGSVAITPAGVSAPHKVRILTNQNLPNELMWARATGTGTERAIEIYVKSLKDIEVAKPAGK